MTIWDRVDHLVFQPPQARVKITGADDQQSQYAHDDEQQADAPAWPDANQLSDGSGEAAIDGEQGFEHIFGERAGDQISERRGRPCNHASYRKDSPLKSGGNLALPYSLTTAIDK